MNYMIDNHPPNSNARSFVGIVETTVEAMRLVYAAHHGIIPRISRRLSRTERQEWIVSGAVFVFDVQESRIQRWTDGLLWTPSRIAGNFLMYREMNEKCKGKGRFEEWVPGGGAHRKEAGSGGRAQKGQHSCSATPSAAVDGGLKIGGLIKKTITIQINGLEYHLISYYTQEALDTRLFPGICSRSDIVGLGLPSSVFQFSNFRHPPIVEIGEDGFTETICDPEILESPVNNSETLSDDTAIQLLEHSDDGMKDQSGCVPFGATPGSSSIPPMQDTSVLAGSRVRIESWQGQYSSTTNEAQSDPQQGYRSRIMSPVKQLEHDHNDSLRRSNEQTSYRHQDQSWSVHPHQSAYSSLLPSTFNANPHSFQLQANDIREGSSTTRSGNGGSRHVGGEQSQLIWLSANNNIVFQDSRSGTSYFHPILPTPDYPLSHDANVYGSLDASPQYSHMTALGRRQSASHKHAQALVPVEADSQPYDDLELERGHEY